MENISIGSSLQATNGDHLSVHYTGRLNDGEGEIFDSSLTKRIPYHFQLGVGQVIQGYEKGVPGMCKGETRTLLVPASMGYGERGVPGTIPGGATLHFTVELLKIQDGELPPPAREKVKSQTLYKVIQSNVCILDVLCSRRNETMF